MKKALLLITPLLLSGCANTPHLLKLSVASPKGAPSVALYKYVKDTEHLEINSDASNIIGYMSNNSKDVVILPTNAGVQAIMNRGANYKIASIITFGNFFLASTGNDDNDTLDADDYVVAFEQNNVPGKIFNLVYGENLNNVHWVNNASIASTCLLEGINATDENATVDYVLIAEPALTNAMSKKDNITIKDDVQEKYREKFDNAEITQAAIFVSNTADKSLVDDFLFNIERDITNLLAMPQIIKYDLKGLEATEISSYFAVGDVEILKSVIVSNRISLGYKKAIDNKGNIDRFLASWNIETNEEIYYQ